MVKVYSIDCVRGVPVGSKDCGTGEIQSCSFVRHEDYQKLKSVAVLIIASDIENLSIIGAKMLLKKVLGEET